MARPILYAFLAVAAFGFACYAAIQCFGYGLAVGGLRGVVGGENALRHYGTLGNIWVCAFLLSLVICGLFIRLTVRSSRRRSGN